MRKLRWLAVAAAALGLAACGGDGENNNSQLSYSDFTREANEICAQADREITPISERLTGEAQNDAPIVEQIVDKQESAIEDIKNLKPPDELQAEFDQFVDISEQQLEIVKEAESAAKAGDTQRYQATLQQLQPLDKDSDQIASRLGAAECAND